MLVEWLFRLSGLWFNSLHQQLFKDECSEFNLVGASELRKNNWLKKKVFTGSAITGSDKQSTGIKSKQRFKTLKWEQCYKTLKSWQCFETLKSWQCYKTLKRKQCSRFAEATAFRARFGWRAAGRPPWRRAWRCSAAAATRTCSCGWRCEERGEPWKGC